MESANVDIPQIPQSADGMLCTARAGSREDSESEDCMNWCVRIVADAGTDHAECTGVVGPFDSEEHADQWVFDNQPFVSAGTVFHIEPMCPISTTLSA